MRAHLFTPYGTIGYFFNEKDSALVPIEVGETLDLAEMFGKEKTE